MTESPLELTVERHINAPPAAVWKIMTERSTEWWCPKPWKTEFTALEWRGGGRMAGMMRGPNPGDESPMNGVFLEVTPGKCFVFTDAFGAGWIPQGPFMVGFFELTPDGAGTRYRAGARHWSQEAYDRHKEMGFEPGWNAVAQQLAELAEA